MYEKNLPNRQGLTPQFQDGVIAFIELAKSQHAYMDGDKIRCPCRKYKNKLFKTTDERVQEYFEAVTAPPLQDEVTSTQLGDAIQINWAQRMVLDAAGPAFCSSTYSQDCAPDDGTRSYPLDAGASSYYYSGDPYDYVSGLADRFHDVLHATEQPLWNGCTISQLAVVAELVDIKADGHISQRIYDRISQWGDHTMPRDHTLPLDYYNTKKLIKDLGLPMEKIDACKNGCMLYWKDDIDLNYCKFCGTARYKPTRVRNPTGKKTPYAVLRLCIDGFAPHGQYGRTYSCWPVILTPYNLPPGMCMSSEYMFLTMVIPGPSNLKRLIDNYLEPLIEELQNLWHVGVLTRDNAKDETFTMRPALMWTVNDLPTYGMASGWSTAGVMGCPVCMEDTRVFYLQNGRNACYFDCHR
ncbi:UNVERIFIED_CONTAM: hypothetical protein Slati_4253300 [Sesamum latifolium]|uniref:Transposase-associated domain-containing protein n=1 Tax=Sesamum latifolium TaxID=2727402 RepID=A0AAW2TBW7_9LAMI